MKPNAIYCGQAARVLGNTLEFPDGTVDLIYMDPPFFSNRNYEVLWGDGYELRAFEDRWQGGIENYIAWMEPVLRECHRVLKPTGTIYLHCDWHANAHLRILMDSIFGRNCLQDEIIWCYRGPSAARKSFARKHDVIYRYTKSDQWTFNPIRVPHRSGIHDTRGTAMAYQGRSVDVAELESRGKMLEDWWADIPSGAHISRGERLGYPTQKPEALLERIITASSNPGDVVLDPFCGCGTAIAVAHKLSRKWVGIDVSPTACRLMVTRMRRLGVSIGDNDIIGLPKSEEEIRSMPPFEFQNWVVRKLMGRVSTRMSGDMGIDGYLFDGTPMQVKQSERIGRNVVDNFETALRRQKRKEGVIVAFSFGKGATEEVARARNQDGINIKLKTVAEIMEEN